MWIATNTSLLPATVLQVFIFLMFNRNSFFSNQFVNAQDGDDEVHVKLDQGGEEVTVPRDSIYQVRN